MVCVLFWLSKIRILLIALSSRLFFLPLMKADRSDDDDVRLQAW